MDSFFRIFSRKDIPSDSPDPALTRRLKQLWVQKKEIEEDMQDALESEDERHYRGLESQRSDVNARMFAALHSSVKPPATVTTVNQPPTSGWNYDGSSYVIYLDHKDKLIPSVVWSSMPVALLYQATAGMLSLSGGCVQITDITLTHDGVTMDPVSGRLSDHPVLRDDVVSVLVDVDKATNKIRNDDVQSRPPNFYTGLFLRERVSF